MHTANMLEKSRNNFLNSCCNNWKVIYVYLCFQQRANEQIMNS